MGKDEVVLDTTAFLSRDVHGELVNTEDGLRRFSVFRLSTTGFEFGDEKDFLDNLKDVVLPDGSVRIAFLRPSDSDRAAAEKRLKESSEE